MNVKREGIHDFMYLIIANRIEAKKKIKQMNVPIPPSIVTVNVPGFKKSFAISLGSLFLFSIISRMFLICGKIAMIGSTINPMTQMYQYSMIKSI